MQMVGQPARDIARHFVQRSVLVDLTCVLCSYVYIGSWNHLLRIKVRILAHADSIFFMLSG